MSQYKVTESFEFDDVQYSKDSIVELSDEQAEAEELYGKIELVESTGESE